MNFIMNSRSHAQQVPNVVSKLDLKIWIIAKINQTICNFLLVFLEWKIYINISFVAGMGFNVMVRVCFCLIYFQLICSISHISYENIQDVNVPRSNNKVTTQLGFSLIYFYNWCIGTIVLVLITIISRQ